MPAWARGPVGTACRIGARAARIGLPLHFTGCGVPPSVLLTHAQLRHHLGIVIENKTAQGHATDGLGAQLAALPDSYDALLAFAWKLADLPLRPDWPYQEPSEWDEVLTSLAPGRATGPIRPIDAAEAAARAEEAFLGSVCGCQLGKPVEINPTLAELRAALERIGQWPLEDYISERIHSDGGLRTLHGSWRQTCREYLTAAAPDDDLNYTILGMLVLEQHGAAFTHAHLRDLWLAHLPPAWTFGPERMVLVKAAADSLGAPEGRFADWVGVLNPQDEKCGAMIRADAYGYACPGDPQRAAELAYRDASFTHRRTGIYGAMFAGAAIATAFIADEPLEIFDTALKYVPQNSRFHAMVSAAFADVATADDWLDGYHRIHQRLGDYGHCLIYQESGTLINTLRFARNVGHGICLQVMQGNDTDSYGATAGSILGAYFGPGHLEPRWLDPLNDTLHTTLGDFHEQSLGNVARRMGRLPALLAASPDGA